MRRLRWWFGSLFAFSLGGFVAWVVWAEQHPESEKGLRRAWREELTRLFPEEMSPPEGEFGWFVRSPDEAEASTGVFLFHGLDEPGDIWEDLAPQLEAPGRVVAEFRYPNDQPVSESADGLAALWSSAPSVERVVLVGHSMGGLVVRDFVTRFGVQGGAENGPRVVGVILLGTPNHGSEWARFRVWLEARDHFEKRERREFSLFAGLRDGSGEAKIDLRPGSAFLRALNARPWPESIPLRLVAGLVTSEKAMASVASLPVELADNPLLAATWEAWWEARRDDLGDGVVALESVFLEGFPEPVVVAASHRGMVRRNLLEKAPPPAISFAVEWVEEMLREKPDETGAPVAVGLPHE